MTTTSELMSALRRRYPAPKWAFLEQVPNATSTYRDRTADALAMGLWKSVGIHFHGFELKVTRSDWQKEMQDVAKAEAFKKYCDYWWLVSCEKVARLEEIPPSWGWLLLTNKGEVRVRKPADKNPSPLPIDRHFLAGLCRSIHRKQPDALAVAQARDEGYQHGYKEGVTQTERRQRHDSERQLRESVAEFERVSGIPINSYNGEPMGRAVKIVQQLGLTNLERQVSVIAEAAQHEAKRWQQRHKELRHAMQQEQDGV